VGYEIASPAFDALVLRRRDGDFMELRLPGKIIDEARVILAIIEEDLVGGNDAAIDGVLERPCEIAEAIQEFQPE